VALALDESLVVSIAAEDETSKREREKLEEKMARLDRGLKQLHRIERHKVSGEPPLNK
jgi:hypothetical protein